MESSEPTVDAEAGPDPAWSVAATCVLDRLVADPERGLTTPEAGRRLELDGPNELPRGRPTSGWERVARQLANPVVYLLGAALVVSAGVWLAEGASGIPFDPIVIAAIVVANTVLGYAQESRAERAVTALRDLTRTEATVIRDGRAERRPADRLVAGDIVALGEGDLVPADLRLIEATGLQVAEAALTGESAPVLKGVEPIEADAPIGDRTPMAFSGTAVVSGRGRAVVTATGPRTEVGRIATLLEQAGPRRTPLGDELDRVGRALGGAVIGIAVAVVALLIVAEGLRTTSELLGAALIGVSLAVAAVPEGLPAVLSLVLALGVQRMADRNALVKRLASVETLGSATVICTDKTGTLTLNRMTVRRVVVPSGVVDLPGPGGDAAAEATGEAAAEARFALATGILASSPRLGDGPPGPGAIGDPTEVAIAAAGAELGVDAGRLQRRYSRLGETPFTSERKWMSTMLADHHDGGRVVQATKGAPEVLLPRCGLERRGGVTIPIDDERRRAWEAVVDRMAAEALRTLAVAGHPVDGEPTDTAPSDTAPSDATPGDRQGGDPGDDLVLLGVVGIIDPPRPEARNAVALARRAGIRVVMITGDHPETARQIASELGIADGDDQVVTGRRLDRTSDEALAGLASEARVYARVSPEHKLRIVDALSGRGEIVGMTGDGVNDAPALRAASIGIAMGRSGTEVARQAADMILTDDNFATIVDAVVEGRAIRHNIASFLRYLLSSNIGEVLTVVGGVVAADLIGLTGAGDGGLATPLLAAQILWINLVTDAAPALALGIDPPVEGQMARPPRRPGRPIIDRPMRVGIAVVGLTMALATLAMLDLRLPGGLVDGSADLATARTGAFTTLVLAQLFNTINARSDTETAFRSRAPNPWLVAAIALSVVLQVLVVHLPALNDAFGTAPLPPLDWVVAAALASSVLWVSELRKLLRRRWWPGRPATPDRPAG